MHSYAITVKVAETHRERLLAEATAERLVRTTRSDTPARKPSLVPRGFLAWLRAGQLAVQA
jgi:hypothetical protein